MPITRRGLHFDGPVRLRSQGRVAPRFDEYPVHVGDFEFIAVDTVDYYSDNDTENASIAVIGTNTGGSNFAILEDAPNGLLQGVVGTNPDGGTLVLENGASGQSRRGQINPNADRDIGLRRLIAISDWDSGNWLLGASVSGTLVANGAPNFSDGFGFRFVGSTSAFTVFQVGGGSGNIIDIDSADWDNPVAITDLTDDEMTLFEMRLEGMNLLSFFINGDRVHRLNISDAGGVAFANGMSPTIQTTSEGSTFNVTTDAYQLISTRAGGETIL